MEWRELIKGGYGRVLQILEKATGGLTPDDMNRQPHPECNSMGWLGWHAARIQDHEIAGLMGEEQLWVSEGWHDKFGHAPDPDDIGYSHSPEDVAAFKSPDVRTILDYNRAVLERTKRYIDTLSESDLDRELDEPWFQPLPTVGVRLVSVMSDNLQHAGQVAYLRGLLKGMGWLAGTGD